jgi:PAS domain S-box-containing protein
MSYVTVTWSVIAACALLLALMYGVVWLLDRRARAALAFSFESLAIVGSVVVELGMMYSTTPEEWGEWVRWNQVPILVRTAALMAFIRFYFETGRPWLMWSVIGTRVVVLVAGFLMDPNFNFSRIDSIDRIPFLGEQITIVGQAVTSPYQWFATLSAYLVLVAVADASITLWRKGTRDARRKVVVIGGAVFLSWAVGSTYTQLMVYGDVRLPALLAPPYLIMLAAMTFELSRDALRASRLARELRDSEARLELAASAAGLGLWLWNPQRNRLWVTSPARAMLGLRETDPLDIAWVRSIIDPADLTRVEKVWRQSASGALEAEVQFRVRLPDGSTRLLAARGRAETDEQGKTTSVQGVLRDVTEQARVLEENEVLRREVAHSDRVSMLGTLSSSLAHELGQPLSAILANTQTAEVLLQRPNPDLHELLEILGDIRRDDRRATEVIDRLRKLLKRGEMDIAPLSPELLVQDVAALLRLDAAARSIRLECVCEPGLPPIRGDRVHLAQVLLNLIMNGMDAVAHQPAAQRHVALRARAHADGSVEFTVDDSGPGIETALLTKVFEPFFTTKPNGMGMGLSVSRTIVDAHQGRLWAENSSRGARFHVTLPAFANEDGGAAAGSSARNVAVKSEA